MNYAWAGGPLAIAVMQDDLVALGALLASGADANARHAVDGTTAAHRAAQHFREGALALLVAHGADLNLATTQTSYDESDDAWPSGMSPRDMLDHQLRTHLTRGWFEEDRGLWERLARMLGCEVEAWCEDVLRTPSSVVGRWRATLAPDDDALATTLMLELFEGGALTLAYPDETVPSRGAWSYDGEALIFELPQRNDARETPRTSVVEADVRGGGLAFEHEGRWVFVRG